MTPVPEEQSRPRTADVIPRLGRTALAAIGTASWAAGATAVFTSENGVGAAALIAAGVACLGLSLAGRWPSRITVSGNELAWENIRETVDSQIEVAEEIENDGAVRELTVLRERLDSLERTGFVVEHPAVEYDRVVEAALRRLVPDATVKKAESRSREIADFELHDGDQRVLIETKWRQNETAPYPGITLPRLFANIPAGAKLLVITNATEHAAALARRLVEQNHGDDARLISWRDVRDDPKLGEALSALLQVEVTM